MENKMRNRVTSIFIAAAILCMALLTAFWSGAPVSALTGDGTPEAPFVISNEAELLEFAERAAENPDVCAELAADITLTEEWTPIASYNGTFDGRYHKIKGLHMEKYASNLGMFAKMTGEIRNLGLEDVMISGKDNIGSFAGTCSGKIINSYCIGDIKGSKLNVGGIAGTTEAGAKLENIYHIGTVSGKNTVGGLVGSFQGEIRACYHLGDVEATATENVKAGMLAAQADGIIDYDSCLYEAGSPHPGLNGQQREAKVVASEAFVNGEAVNYLNGETADIWCVQDGKTVLKGFCNAVAETTITTSETTTTTTTTSETTTTTRATTTTTSETTTTTTS